MEIISRKYDNQFLKSNSTLRALIHRKFEKSVSNCAEPTCESQPKAYCVPSFNLYMNEIVKPAYERDNSIQNPTHLHSGASPLFKNFSKINTGKLLRELTTEWSSAKSTSRMLNFQNDSLVRQESVSLH